MNISGSHAIVTGAASGLGAATARHLAGLGAQVSLFDRSRDAAGAVADEIGGTAVPVDVSDEAQVEQAVAAAVAAHAAPRIVVNCAGIATGARIVDRQGTLSVDAFRRTLDVNLIGTFIVMSHAARAMMAGPADANGARGVVVNTASVAWQDGQVGQTAYAASKGGVAALCLPAARELARFGIRVMAIAPGVFDTAMVGTLSDEIVAGVAANIPFPSRLGVADEYAALVAHIAANDYLNATTIRLDGGVRLPPK